MKIHTMQFPPISLLFHPSWVQIFSSAPYPQTLSVYYSLPLLQETKFHTHTKLQANSLLYKFQSIAFQTAFLKAKKCYLHNRPWRPIGLWDFEDPTVSI
jgi:hypothetical protein